MLKLSTKGTNGSSLLGRDQDRRRGMLKGTDFQIIRFNLSKVKELSKKGSSQKRKKA